MSKSRINRSNLGQSEASEELKAGAPKKEKKGFEKKKKLEGQIAEAEAKAQESYDRLLRVTAEFENYKKRMEREMNDFRKYANESLVKDILPTVDNLERALATSEGENMDAAGGIRDGVKMTLQGLLDCLKRHGVAPVDALDKPFDPNIHQAVMQEESARHPENTVSQELQKGYTLQERLLRPAMVVVAKKPTAAARIEPKKGEKVHKIKVTTE